MFESELKETLRVLAGGGLILYPTDTIWGIGCDATNPAAVDNIFALKNRPPQKTMIILVANDFMLEKYVEMVPDAAYDIIEFSTKPTTIIYDNPKGVAKNLIAPDNTLAVRVATDEFCRQLIKKFKKPIVSTSANRSGLPSPANYSEIDPDILKGVDYVVNLDRDKHKDIPSSIIKLGNDGTVKVIRK